MREWELHLGDALRVLPAMPDGSVDAVVCDPPAGISFMGSKWDSFGGRCNGNAVRDRAAGHQGPGAGNGNQPFAYSGSALPKAGERAAFLAFLTPIMAQCLRVLKPGGYALVWALPRTSHWTATALEDAGFEIRDKICHLFGQGFPKGKACLKPGYEEWILCRRPGPRVLPLNIEECRVGADLRLNLPAGNRGGGNSLHLSVKGMPVDAVPTFALGRWPANLVLTHHEACVCRGTKRVLDVEGLPDSRKDRINVAVVKDAVDLDALTAQAGIDEVVPRSGPPPVVEAGVVDLQNGGERREKKVNYATPVLGDDGPLVRESDPRGGKAGGDLEFDGRDDEHAPRVRRTSVPGELPVVKLPAERLTSHGAEDAPAGPLDSPLVREKLVAADAADEKGSRDPVGNPDLVGTGGGTSGVLAAPELGIVDAVHVGADGANSVVVGHGGTSDGHCTITQQSGKEVEDWACVEECPVRLLDEQAGERNSGGPQSGKVYEDQPAGGVNCYGDGWARKTVKGYTDSGNVSRFFYVSKADRADRGEGNDHATVKPTALMSWLVKLVSRPGETVLDPFAGSGSTGVAALRCERRFVGIERDAHYHAIALKRLAAVDGPLFAAPAGEAAP